MVYPMTVDPRVALAFESKAPHLTCWIAIEAPMVAPPADLFAALQAAGWSEGLLGPAYPGPNGYLIQEYAFSKHGSALFNGWTATEAKANLAAARTILARFGFDHVPHNHLRLQDLL